MKKITKALSLVMIMTLCIFTLTACGGSDDANAGADTEKEAMTMLVFGTSADYAPFEFMYPDENGDMVYGGIDVEVAQYIADYMGVKLQTENMSFNNLLTALNKGQFDIVLADIEATDERKEAADFSNPYLTELAPQFLVKKRISTSPTAILKVRPSARRQQRRSWRSSVRFRMSTRFPCRAFLT